MQNARRGRDRPYGDELVDYEFDTTRSGAGSRRRVAALDARLNAVEQVVSMERYADFGLPNGIGRPLAIWRCSIEHVYCCSTCVMMGTAVRLLEYNAEYADDAAGTNGTVC